MAVWIDSNSSEDEIFEVVFEWIDVLSKGDYGRVARELGYWDFDIDAATAAIRRAIEEYRSPELFPNVEDFTVSDWRLATGGNREPRRDIVWYKENTVGIVVSVCVDLPLNGAWSDLAADFLLFERGEYLGQYQLRLEEITQPLRNHKTEDPCE